MKNYIGNLPPVLNLKGKYLEQKKELFELLQKILSLINSEQFKQIFTDSFY